MSIRNRDPNPIKIFKKPSRVKASYADEANINKIMERYTRTGSLPSMIKSNPMYGDFANVPEYQTACNTVIKAREQFAALPAPTRAFFNHDPSQMLQFCSNPQNNNQMIKLGLAVPKTSGHSDKKLNTKVLNEAANNTDNKTKVD